MIGRLLYSIALKEEALFLTPDQAKIYNYSSHHSTEMARARKMRGLCDQ
jgi:hypothetical protein